MGSSEKAGEEIFARICIDKTGDKAFKLNKGGFRLDIMNKFFTVRVVKHGKSLSRKIVNVQSLELLQRMIPSLNKLYST